MQGFNVNMANGKFLVLEITLILINLGSFLLFVFCALVLLYNPRGVIFLGGLISEKYSNVFLTILATWFHTYILAVLCSNIAALGGPIVMYAYYLYFMISQEIRLGRKCYVANDKLRNSDNLRITYRSLQILNQQALVNCPLGTYLVLLNGFFMLAAIYISFVLIRYWEMLQFISKAPMVIAEFWAIGYWTIILQIGCMFFVDGNKTLNSWKRHNWGCERENRLMKKFRQSCKPILLSFGSQFVIGRMSVLNYYQGVLRGTFRVLLATK